jgi:hypothetical protein
MIPHKSMKEKMFFVMPAALMMLCLVVSGHAAEQIKGKQPCRFLWDYPSDVPMLGFFRVYVRLEGTDYDMERLVKIIPAVPEMVTGFDCTAVILSQPRHYYAIVTAVSVLNEESAPSNEIDFLWGEVPAKPPTASPSKPPPTKPPAPPSPPVSHLPPPPAPLRPPSPTPIPPKAPASTGPYASESCQFLGTCGYPNLLEGTPKKAQGGLASQTCQFTGSCN